MRVAIYTRVSTRMQADEGYSLEAQDTILTAWCTRNEHEVIDRYSDEGISGKDIKHRPEMQRLMSDVSKSKIDLVLVWKLTRLTRSLGDLCKICERFDRYGVALVSYSETFNFSTPSGKLMLNILGVIAQWEREVISENVKAAMRQRAMSGKITCSYVLGYDRVGDSLVINPAEAETVRRIYNWYLECHSLVEVAQRCVANDIRGKMGGRIKPESVHKILTRCIYCGYYTWHCEPIYKSDTEPIIDISTYNTVQQILLMRGIRLGRRRTKKIHFLPED